MRKLAVKKIKISITQLYVCSPSLRRAQGGSQEVFPPSPHDFKAHSSTDHSIEESCQQHTAKRTSWLPLLARPPSPYLEQGWTLEPPQVSFYLSVFDQLARLVGFPSLCTGHLRRTRTQDRQTSLGTGGLDWLCVKSAAVWKVRHGWKPRRKYSDRRTLANWQRVRPGSCVQNGSGPE